MEILARGLPGQSAPRHVAEVPWVVSETVPILFRRMAAKDVKELVPRLRSSHVGIAFAQVCWCRSDDVSLSLGFDN